MVSRDQRISPPVHALHFGLAEWVTTPAPRQLSETKLSGQLLFSHVLTFYTAEIRYHKEKPQCIENQTLVLYTAMGDRRTITPPGRGGPAQQKKNPSEPTPFLVSPHFFSF